MVVYEPHTNPHLNCQQTFQALDSLPWCVLGTATCASDITPEIKQTIHHFVCAERICSFLWTVNIEAQGHSLKVACLNFQTPCKIQLDTICGNLDRKCFQTLFAFCLVNAVGREGLAYQTMLCILPETSHCLGQANLIEKSVLQADTVTMCAHTCATNVSQQM